MLKFGLISEIDAPKGLARVFFPDEDGMVSQPLPISVPKTLKDKFSIPFDINEHVWCLMDDNLEFGVIGGAIYSTKDLPDNGVPGNIRITLLNGLFIDYSRETRLLTIGGNGDVKINVPAGNVDITCLQGSVTAETKLDVNAPIVNMSGLLNVAGIMTAGGIATSAPAIGISTGDAVITGKLQIAGDIETTGTVKAGTVDLKLHTHTGVQTGAAVSGPPTE